jgi:ABC-type Fe3+-citrate transport system substrate-binding protein
MKKKIAILISIAAFAVLSAACSDTNSNNAGGKANTSNSNTATVVNNNGNKNTSGVTTTNSGTAGNTNAH